MWFFKKQKTIEKTYTSVIERTANMTQDVEVRRLAKRHKLDVLNVTWEDTGRYKGSYVGPNISDMTIQVEDSRSGRNLTCMPVIRPPNFSDKTADLPLDQFNLLVGNQRGRSLRAVTLREYLGDLRKYLHDPDSWVGGERSLLAERDTHVLVSAQACFLPVSKKAKATFNPVLFNYQSRKGAPAVLTVLASREGTSATIIDNQRDGFSTGFSWGQRLFFNDNGERASLTGERISDFKGEVSSGADQEAGLNMVLLIQVPLLQPKPKFLNSSFGGPGGMPQMCAAPAARMSSNVEAAVISHGEVEGPHTEIDGLPIKRDERFPIRVTVQFYKATSNGVVSPEDMAQIAGEIEQVYADATCVGSLVTQGMTQRPTEYDSSVSKKEPAKWWEAFWLRHQMNTGLTKMETIRRLREVFGDEWTPISEEELAEAVRRVF